MRANEFITEGPLDQLGAWMQQQSIGRKIKDRAKAQKKKLPIIAKEVQKLLAARVLQVAKSDVEDKQTELANQVMSVMSKSTKVDIEGNEELFKDSMDALLRIVKADAAGVASNKQVRTLISDIVNKSFSLKTTGAASMEKFEKDFLAGIKSGKDPKEALANAAQSSGLDPKEFDTSTMPDVEPVLTGPIDPDAEEGSVYYEDLMQKVKDHLVSHPEQFGNRDAAAEFVNAQLEDVKNVDERDAIVDQLMHDKDMPFNLGFGEQFRALVYSPSGTRYKQGSPSENIAYIKHKGMWSQWEIGPHSNWRLKKKVKRKEDLKGLQGLSQAGTTAMVPLSFRQEKVEGQENLYRVSAR